ncbi:MAG: triacylglycerol lipase [Deltaproteobacteria bacterium]|nr:triacylglycerol lipase [Deltaproteobacteria bacterium]
MSSRRLAPWLVIVVGVVLAASGCAALEEMWASIAGPPPQGDAQREVTDSERRAPILLLHGMAGFDAVIGVEYFYKVPEALTTDGHAVVAAVVDPFNSVARRAEQVATQLDKVLLATGARGAHLIAHSQGGLDARYLISTLGYGDRVLSLTTIATPHHGTLIADAALGWVPNLPAEADYAFALIDKLGHGVTGTDVDLQAQLWGLTRRYVEGTFNPQNPDDPRVRYYSYAGVTQAWPFVDRETVDIVNPGLLASYLTLKALEGENDGMVSVKSARWGAFLGVLAADHMDEVGQPMGATSKAFDHLAFYRALSRFVTGEGPAPRLRNLKAP